MEPITDLPVVRGYEEAEQSYQEKGEEGATEPRGKFPEGGSVPRSLVDTGQVEGLQQEDTAL